MECVRASGFLTHFTLHSNFAPELNKRALGNGGQKLAAVRLLRYCSHIFYPRVDMETYTKITTSQRFSVGKHNRFCMSSYAQINKVCLFINNYVFMRFCFEC